MRRSLVTAAVTALAVSGLAAVTPAAANAPSDTSLVLSATQSPYGRTVTASAIVTTSSGPAEGDVWFSVDGRAFKTNLSGGGTATAVLPDALVGPHEVVATFVPQVPGNQPGSTSPTVTWQVVPVRTRLEVRVIGRTAKAATAVQVTAAGDYGTTPTGRVKVVLIRLGTGDRKRVVERLDDGLVRVGLGRLPTGYHRAVVTYVGDANHLRERRVERFHVRRG